MQGGLDRLPRTARKVNQNHAIAVSAPIGIVLPMASNGPDLAPPKTATPERKWFPST